eukprot:TRINITY_DN7972_c0_g1_i1.p1 TRINITY_DN7972_c0_g1~~TRINITY_DN7972_c0_g1_i1.p1  ORF type:complete len:380 (+),score=58.64 TRINITY_DN7972_c0_g1_i1:110-1249(+)
MLQGFKMYLQMGVPALLILCALFLGSIPTATAVFEFKGMTVTAGKYCPNVTFSSDRATYTMKHLRTLGVEWIALVATEYQDHGNSVEIYHLAYPNFHRELYYTYLSESLEELTYIVRVAKQVGLKVMMKPHIDQVYDGTMNWRGEISNGDWGTWFASYELMMMKYARFSEAMQLDMLSVECELIGVSPQNTYWEALIAKIRQVYKGPLTASANYGGEETSKQWWDKMDYIGIDAYYTGVRSNSPYPRTETDVPDVVRNWQNIDSSTIKPLSDRFNKPVLFTEIGFCTGGNCERSYNVSENDIKSHGFLYDGMLEAFKNVTHWKGVFFWGWMADGAYGGPKDMCMSPQYKPAEDALRKHFGATLPKMRQPPYPATCLCTI